MGVGAAIAGGAVVSGVLGQKSSKSQSKAAEQSAEAQLLANRESIEFQREALEKNIDFQREIFDQQRADIAPWRNAGIRSLRRMSVAMRKGEFDAGPFKFKFKESPGYQFARDEGISGAAARGRLLSGGHNKAIMRYATGLASQDYDQAFNRAIDRYRIQAGEKSDRFNRYASLAGVGQTATRDIAGARSQMASDVGRSTVDVGRAASDAAIRSGQAIAQGAQQAGQARASGYQNLAGTVNTGLQNYLLYNMLGS